MEERLCYICNEPLEDFGDNRKKAHEICLFAQERAGIHKRFLDRDMRDVARSSLMNLAFAITGLTRSNEIYTEDGFRDKIISVHRELESHCVKKYKAKFDLSKRDKINVKFNKLQPFHRLEFLAKEMGFTSGSALIRIASATYCYAKKRLEMPDTWDEKLIDVGLNPKYIRTGKGNPMLK